MTDITSETTGLASESDFISLPRGKSSVVDKDGNVLEITDRGAAKTEEIPREETPKTFEDETFVVGDSPAILDANARLGRRATEFSIQNDGVGNFTVAVSHDGITYGDEKTVRNGEIYAIDNVSFFSIRITHVADSAYRVTVL